MARIVYLSRIPPGMGPSQVKHLLSQYGQLGRVFLKRDEHGTRNLIDTPRAVVTERLRFQDTPASRRQREKHRAHRFAEGWIEFVDKKVARNVAEMLNASPIGRT